MSNDFEAVVPAWGQLLRAVGISKTYQAAYGQNAKMEEETMVVSILPAELTSTEWKNAVVRHQDTQQPQGHLCR